MRLLNLAIALLVPFVTLSVWPMGSIATTPDAWRAPTPEEEWAIYCQLARFSHETGGVNPDFPLREQIAAEGVEVYVWNDSYQGYRIAVARLTKAATNFGPLTSIDVLFGMRAAPADAAPALVLERWWLGRGKAPIEDREREAIVAQVFSDPLFFVNAYRYKLDVFYADNALTENVCHGPVGTPTQLRLEA